MQTELKPVQPRSKHYAPSRVSHQIDNEQMSQVIAAAARTGRDKEPKDHSLLRPPKQYASSAVSYMTDEQLSRVLDAGHDAREHDKENEAKTTQQLSKQYDPSLLSRMSSDQLRQVIKAASIGEQEEQPGGEQNRRQPAALTKLKTPSLRSIQVTNEQIDKILEENKKRDHDKKSQLAPIAEGSPEESLTRGQVSQLLSARQHQHATKAEPISSGEEKQYTPSVRSATPTFQHAKHQLRRFLTVLSNLLEATDSQGDEKKPEPQPGDTEKPTVKETSAQPQSRHHSSESEHLMSGARQDSLNESEDHGIQRRDFVEESAPQPLAELRQHAPILHDGSVSSKHATIVNEFGYFQRQGSGSVCFWCYCTNHDRHVKEAQEWVDGLELQESEFGNPLNAAHASDAALRAAALAAEKDEIMSEDLVSDHGESMPHTHRRDHLGKNCNDSVHLAQWKAVDVALKRQDTDVLIFQKLGRKLSRSLRPKHRLCDKVGHNHKVERRFCEDCQDPTVERKKKMKRRSL